MDFERETKPDCKFSIVDHPTVRQQLDYFSVVGGAYGKDMLVRYWEGARAMIISKSWKCKSLPDFDKIDIDALTNPEHTKILIWAGLQVRNYMNSLESIPKN